MKNVFVALALSLMTQSAFASTFAAGSEVEYCGILHTPSTSPSIATDADYRLTVDNQANSPIILVFDLFGAAQQAAKLNRNDSYLACVSSPEGIQQGFEGGVLFAVTLEIIGVANSEKPLHTFCGAFKEPTIAGPQLLLSVNGDDLEVLPMNNRAESQVDIINAVGAASVSGCIYSHEPVQAGIEGPVVETDLLTISAK